MVAGIIAGVGPPRPRGKGCSIGDDDTKGGAVGGGNPSNPPAPAPAPPPAPAAAPVPGGKRVDPPPLKNVEAPAPNAVD